MRAGLRRGQRLPAAEQALEPDRELHLNVELLTVDAHGAPGEHAGERPGQRGERRGHAGLDAPSDAESPRVGHRRQGYRR